MSTPLRYRFQLGEAQRFRSQTTMRMQHPQAGELEGRTLHEIQLQALEESPQGGWILKLERRLREASGPLAEQMPERERQDRSLRFRMTPSGAAHDLGQGLPARFPCFPEGALHKDSTWQTQEPTAAGSPLNLRHTVTRLEERGGEQLAEIVSQTEETGQDQQQSRIQSTCWFSVSRGRLVGSQTVIRMSWPDGRSVETTIQLQPAG